MKALSLSLTMSTATMLQTYLIYRKASCRSPARVSQSPSHQCSGRDESSCAGADPEAKPLVVECSNARSCSTSFYKKRQIFQLPHILLTTSPAVSLARKQTCTWAMLAPRPSASPVTQ